MENKPNTFTNERKSRNTNKNVNNRTFVGIINTLI